MAQKLQINLEENLRKEEKKILNNKEIERTKKKEQKPAIRWNFKA